MPTGMPRTRARTRARSRAAPIAAAAEIARAKRPRLAGVYRDINTLRYRVGAHVLAPLAEGRGRDPFGATAPSVAPSASVPDDSNQNVGTIDGSSQTWRELLLDRITMSGVSDSSTLFLGWEPAAAMPM